MTLTELEAPASTAPQITRGQQATSRCQGLDHEESSVDLPEAEAPASTAPQIMRPSSHLTMSRIES